MTLWVRDTDKACQGAIYVQSVTGPVPTPCAAAAVYRYVGDDDAMPAHVCETCRKAYA